MDKSLEDGEVASLGASGGFLITIHGIGPYDASHGAAQKLMGALDPSLVETFKFKPIDFDWSAMVEGGHDDSERVTQLSASILEAAHVNSDEQTDVVGYLVIGAGFFFEALFKISILSVAIFTLLLASAVTTYVRFGSFGLGEAGASTVLHWVAVLWTLVVASFAIGLILCALLRTIGLRFLAASLLRRIVLVLLQPLLPLAYRLGEAETRKMLWGLALFALFYGILVGSIHWWSTDVASQWPGLDLKNLSFVAAGLASVYFAALGVSKVIIVPVKLARDIFNYIGDVHQRTLIQEGLSQRVKDKSSDRGHMPRDTHVIIVDTV
jgi:hypothetical protein